MAHTSLTLKIVSEAVKSGGRCTRALHDGVAVKKGLHNTESVVGLVADSMGRSRVKLTAADVERNGMTRVGPSPDILHQVTRAGAEAMAANTTEPPIEQNGFVMTDPNSSMWNLCKGNKEVETTAKKLTKKFIKMKDNIKQYYLDRLEENQVLFTEIEEPLRIGKIDKKERASRYKEAREDELEPLPEIQAVPMQRPRKAQRANLFNQLQRPEAEMEAKSGLDETTYLEPQLKGGYRRFNKTEYKKSVEDSGDAEAKSNRTLSKAEERACMDQDRPLAPSMWKRSQVKVEKEAKDSRGDGGFSDVPGTLSPPVHFKTGVGSSGLLGSMKTGNLVQGFYKKRINESRNFSTLMKDGGEHKSKRLEGYDLFKPVPLMLQREIALNCRHKRLTDNKLITAHSISTCCTHYNNDDPMRPPPMPPKNLQCDPCDKLPKCPKPEGFKWPCCTRITLCGCDPVNPRIDLPNCGLGDLKPFVTMAKRPEYICPSFSECLRRTEMNTKKTNECCIGIKKVCDNYVGPKKPYITALERQEISLGQKYWTGQKQPCCNFHSSAKYRLLRPRLWEVQNMQRADFHITAQTAAEEECDRPGKGQLPCQRTVNIPGSRKKDKAQSKGSCECEKLCMPCCEPARDPPECLSIYQKPPCTKFKNPRPAFSECRKRFPFRHTMCECEVPAKPRCEQKKKQSDSTC